MNLRVTLQLDTITANKLIYIFTGTNLAFEKQKSLKLVNKDGKIN